MPRDLKSFTFSGLQFIHPWLQMVFRAPCGSDVSMVLLHFTCWKIVDHIYWMRELLFLPKIEKLGNYDWSHDKGIPIPYSCSVNVLVNQDSSFDEWSFVFIIFYFYCLRFFSMTQENCWAARLLFFCPIGWIVTFQSLRMWTYLKIGLL